MADSPYQLDPFTTITDIHFGSGKYLLLSGFSQSLAGGVAQGVVQLTFPSIAGGTPGFTPVDAGAFPTGAIPGPVTLSAKQIAGSPLATLAGAPFKGFIVSGTDGFIWGSNVWLPIQGVLTKQFGIRMFLSPNGDTASGVIGLYDKGIIKAGVLYSSTTFSTGTTPTPTVSAGTFIEGSLDVQANFTVDPVAMTVQRTS